MLSVVSSLCTSTFYWSKLLVKIKQKVNPSSQIRVVSLSRFNQCWKLSLPPVTRSLALAGILLKNQTPVICSPSCHSRRFRATLKELFCRSHAIHQISAWTVSLNCSEVLWFSFSSVQTSVLFCWPQISFFLWMSLMGFESLDGVSVGGPGLSEVGVGVMMLFCENTAWHY